MHSGGGAACRGTPSAASKQSFKVELAPPVVFKDIPVKANEPLKILIEPTGANPEAKIGKYGYVFGLDCIDVSPAGGERRRRGDSKLPDYPCA